MKFRYEYRTSDNVRHSDVITAKSREGVFTQLAKKGIKPGLVEQLPDPWRPVRVLAYVIIGAAALASIGYSSYFAISRHIAASTEARLLTVAPETRKQLYGNPLVVERGVACDWSDVFTERIDRVLSRYAQPGWKVEKKIADEDLQALAVGLLAQSNIKYVPNELNEHRQLKRIVLGIREEAREFVDAGGDPTQFLRLLDERQDAEIAARVKIDSEYRDSLLHLPDERHHDAWQKANRKLRALGLRMIPMPDSSVSTQDEDERKRF